jgi:DNA-binding MarR family transcriptional regulator
MALTRGLLQPQPRPDEACSWCRIEAALVTGIQPAYAAAPHRKIPCVFDILACMQSMSVPTQTTDGLAADLYALVIYIHKDCNSDLFEAVGALDLTLTQIKFLHYLEDAEEPLSLKEAAGLVKVSLPAASRLVDDLVRRGFVERHEDLEDRRMKRVSPTSDGRAVIRRLNAARLSGLQGFTESLTDPERELLQSALAKLLDRPEVAACRPEDV